jgi:hypothetical protein
MDGELKISPEVKEPVELKTPERAPEVQAVPVVEQRPSTLPKATPLDRPTPLPPLTKDQELQVIERILEDGLLDVFLEMSGAQRSQFRADGEALATLVRGYVGQPKAIRPHALQVRVQAWLKSIGGVDRYWLMQAMKIKTGGLLEEIRGDEEQF